MVRIKQRYLVTEILFPNGPVSQRNLQLTSKELHHCLRDHVVHYFGDYMAGTLHRPLAVKYLNWQTRVAIIRTSRGTELQLTQALSLLRKIESNVVTLNTIHIGGTLRSCYKFLKV